jgi:zinc protease
MPNTDPSSIETGLFRFYLPNQAVLIVKEVPSTPVVSLNLWVDAGSIDETPDERGMAHLIEHMIFKGTAKRGVGQISREVEAAGGYLNAFTSFEHTCFYVVLPADQIQKAMDVEFDAYFHSTFDAGELEKEKEVVFEEMRMRRDDPWSWSWEILFRELFKKNPYHWPVIGDEKILKTVPREKLMAYYRRHYTPRNTVLVIVGNVKAGEIHAWVKKSFGTAKAGNPPRRFFKSDSEPQGLKLAVEKGEIKQTYLSLGFPTVPQDHEDGPAMEILDSILGEGHSGRLNMAIKEKSRSADEVGSDHFMGKYGGAFTFQGLTDSARSEKFLRDLMSEVRHLLKEGVGVEELQKVKTKVRASKVFEKQNVDGQAKSLGYWELMGDYHKEEAYMRALEGVTSADLQRVAGCYLKPSRATLVVYQPIASKFPLTAKACQKLLEESFFPQPVKKSLGKKKIQAIERVELPGGSTLYLKIRPELPLVSLGLFFKGGFVNEGEKRQGLTHLLTRCLTKGTENRTYEQFSARVEGLAAHLDPFMEKDYWGMTLDCLDNRFSEAFPLMMEALLQPGFTHSGVEKEKGMQIAALKRQKDDPADYALLKSDLLTFQGTPYGQEPMGTVKTVSVFDVKDIVEWQKAFLGKANLTWVAVGNFKKGELIKTLREKTLLFPKVKGMVTSLTGQTSWKKDHFRETLKSQQSHIVLGMRAPNYLSGDYIAFRVLNTLLGGMGGRLFAELRDQKSLAYSVHASHDAAIQSGIFQVYIGCAPSKVQAAKEGLVEVLRDFAQKLPSNADLERAKTYLIGLYQMNQQSNRSQVYSYGRYALSGLGLDIMDKLPARVKAVTAAQVQAVAQRYLLDPQRTWVEVGP